MNGDDIYSDEKTGGEASFMGVGNQVCGFGHINFFFFQNSDDCN